jgi:hypothetical protein
MVSQRVTYFLDLPFQCFLPSGDAEDVNKYNEPCDTKGSKEIKGASH